MTRLFSLKVTGKPLLRGKHFYWNLMMELDRSGPFSTGDVHRKTNDKDDAGLRKYIRNLVKCGYAEPVGSRPGPDYIFTPIPLYKLTQRSVLPPPMTLDGKPLTKGLMAQCMWNILRGPQARGGITPAELALLASTETVQIAASTAREYCYALYGAGFLKLLGPHGPGLRSVYALSASGNTGPLAPIRLRAAAIYDPNSENLASTILDAVEDER